MKNSYDVLSSILKTTQMGQVGIRAVMDDAAGHDLKQALHSQLKEYADIEKEAYALAASRGIELAELDPMAKYMAGFISRTQLHLGKADSKIAAMMINGNTRGMIKGYKNLHNYHAPDAQISALGQKLLDTERANIRQMQGYL